MAELKQKKMADEMPKIKKMRMYCRLTKIDNKLQVRYNMRADEITELYKMAQLDIFNALFLAFEFGRSKGYRAAKSIKR